MNAVVQAADGRVYALGAVSSPDAYVVFSRALSETNWTQIYEGASPSSEGEAITTDDAVYFTLGHGRLLRLAGAQVTEETYEQCSSNCKYRITGFFRTSKNQLRAFAQTKGPILERDSHGTWTPVIASLPRLITPLAALAGGGFVGLCRELNADPNAPFSESCLGDTGDDITVFSLPDGQIPTGRVFSTGPSFAVLGQSLNDFYAFSEAGTLYHRVGDEFLKEGLPALPAGATGKTASLMRLRNGTLYAIREKDAFKLDGDCWRPLGEGVPVGLPLAANQVGVPTGYTSFCTSEMP